MQESVSLLPYNTLQVNCIAKYFVEIPNTYQLLQFLETEERKTNNHWIVWWWSNTLFLNDYYDWIVLHPNIKWIETIKETDNELFLQVGAWEDRNDFVHYTIDNNLCWIENLILIPWNVWTSAVSNIWAYGQEASEVIEEVIGVNLETNTIQKLSNEECNFSYRNSIFKHQLKGSFIITHVVFRLQKLSESYILPRRILYQKNIQPTQNNKNEFIRGGNFTPKEPVVDIEIENFKLIYDKFSLPLETNIIYLKNTYGGINGPYNFEHIKNLYWNGHDFANVYNARAKIAFRKFYSHDEYLCRENRI